METLIRAALAFGMVLAASTAAQAGDSEWDDIWAPYVQRVDKATATSGNAAEVNSATQIVTPWPHGVRNRRIPGNGARQAGAIGRYENSLLQNGAGAASPIAKNTGETGDNGQTGGGNSSSSNSQKAGDNGGQPVQ